MRRPLWVDAAIRVLQPVYQSLASVAASRSIAVVRRYDAKVRDMAEEVGASAAVVEQVYRAMISAFIAEELNIHAKLTQGASGSGA
ncbi:hypothetical protein ACIPZ5_27590 [Pseudomonas sp. NPDC089428]|uniref:hypothetical protein n=1 Tax=Pseudomonas sp. NPDC089428 TaxID=3364467 RepID=UPI0038202C36